MTTEASDSPVSEKGLQWAGELHLVYRIDQRPNEVDVFLLSRTLEALGNLLTESDRVLRGSATDDFVISIAPFEDGSFVMDFLLQLKKDSGVLFVLSQTEAVRDLKATVETLGLIKKIGSKALSLLDIVRKLGGEKPKKIRKKKKDFEYEAKDGSRFSVPPEVNNLYNNGVIHNHFYAAVAAPLENTDAKSIETYVKSDKKRTLISVSGDDIEALKTFSTPALEPPVEESIENTITQVLRPKSGNYGEHLGLWTFTIAGTKRILKAKITDENFLGKYTRGAIRFYQGDLLKVRLRETQLIKSDDITVENEILEVIQYTPGTPQQLPSNSGNSSAAKQTRRIKNG